MRKLRGYLAFCGLDRHLNQLADAASSRHCDTVLAEQLNPDMLDHYQSVLFRNGELVVLVDRPHWAADSRSP